MNPLRRMFPFHGGPLVLACLAVALLATAAAAVVTPPVFILKWGTTGSGPGQFSGPAGVAVDGAGDVYVADTGNNRVQKFDANGVFITQWGTLGSGPGQFSGPFGIAVRGSSVYVVDTGNDRVEVFTSGGTFVTQWGSAGTGNGQFQQPLCIAVDMYNQVYVTDYNLNRVQQFSNTGTYYNQWGTTGTGTGQFTGMSGIAVDGMLNVYITDSGNHRIEQFNSSGFFIGQWGTLGAGNGQLNYPFGVAAGGGHVYGVDTFNQRIQMFDPSGTYEAQWGSAGAGNGQFNYPHAAATEFGLVYVADTQQDRIQKFGPAPPETCATCSSPPDGCCEGVPTVGGPWTNVLVGTREAGFSYPYVVTIFNLNTPSPTPPEDENWASITRYNGPGGGWVQDSLGTVFGLTLDASGNIFVTHSSCYQSDAIGNLFGSAPGAVYRIDGATGAMKTFCVLPNFPDGSLSPPDNFPGLGNITYDCQHDQFFVTDLEDGKIYRIKPTGTTGTVVETFDPLLPDNGAPGFAPKGQRLWGVQYHANRVYYSVWASDLTSSTGPNEIRSVALLPSGAFSAGTDQHELYLPPLTGQTFSMPVADISFSASGRMLLGERGIQQDSYPAPHLSRVWEYVCNNGCWQQGNVYLIGDYGSQTNAAGGVDYDRHTYPGGPVSPIGRVWATGDALHLYGSYPDAVYGYQGMRPNTNSSNVNSKLVDSDGNVGSGDKTLVGDIEAPGCPVSDFGSLCGTKYLDLNHNGVRDGGEPGLSNWTIQITGPGGTLTVTTDASGDYCFTNLISGTYTLSEVGVSPYVQTAPPGGTYTVNLSGQVLYGYDFGNYAGNGVGGVPCVQPPTGMAAWWPFNEPPSSTSVADVTHLSPARNVAQLFGAASINTGAYVKNSLCFPSELDYAKVPYANQLGLQWGAGPFAMDVWIKAPAGGTPRIIAEYRKLVSPSPYKTLGWALYLNGLQSYLEIGYGIGTQIVPGPTIPAGTWTHIAVSVARSPAAGTWYLNGVLQPAFNFTPTPGSISANVDLYMGKASPPFASFGIGQLQGCIDELELFSTSLTAATVQKIYAAGVVGKCPEYCSLPSITTLCKNQTSVSVCFNICNNTGTTQSYHWSLAGLPVGPGCSVAGPVTFSPPAGAVVVPSGACSPPICVTIPRPAGLTTQNATSCYALTMVNDVTGDTHTCTGTLRADYSCYCATPIESGITYVGRSAVGTGIAIGIGFPCDPISALPYKLVPVFTNTDHEDPLAVSLNGLPPGEPYIGTFTRMPGAPSGEIDVNVRYPNGYDGFAPYEIVLEADTDGDGQYEPLCTARVQSSYDSTETVAVPAGPRFVDSVKLLASPNPFFGGSRIDFTLARADRGDLSVFDLSGRRVRTIKSGAIEAGVHRFNWDGRDDHGQPAAAGVYFVRLSTDRLNLESKMVKLR